MRTLDRWLCLGLLATVALLSACGGRSSAVVRPGPSNPPAESGIAGSVLRTTSGLPTGIKLTWTGQADAASYNIYKSNTLAGLDSARGNAALQVATGVTVTNFTDDFGAATPLIGETWYYRISASDNDGDESQLSKQLAVVISLHFITSTDVPGAAPGENVTINGGNFGVQQDPTDMVCVMGVVWNADHFDAAEIPCAVVSWSETQIVATIPDGFASSQIEVEIAGVAVAAPLNNTAPFITALTGTGPTVDSGDVTHTITLVGGNFGTGADGTHFVHMGQPGGQDIPPGTSYVSYTDTQIVFHPANFRPGFGTQSVQVSAGGVRSNSGFFDLLNAAPIAQVTANPTTGPAPLVVNFDASGSNDPEGTALSYDWDFDNDGSADLTTPTPLTTHTYPAQAVQDAVVTVTDADGGQTTSAPVLTITVTQAVPVVTVTPTPAETAVNINVGFTANAVPPTGATITSYDWDWEGDGTYDVVNGGTVQNHVYSTSGVYRPTVQAHDDLGGIGASTNGVVKVWSATHLASNAKYTKLAVVNGHPAVAYIVPGAAAPTRIFYQRATDAAGYVWPAAATTITTSAGIATNFDTLDIVDTATGPLVFYNDGNNLVMQNTADRDGANWIPTPLIINTLAGGGVRDTSVVLANGNPAVAYVGTQNGDVEYQRAATAAGAGWQPAVQLEAAGGTFCDLAIVQGNPAVAYCQGANVWYVRALDSSGNTALFWPGVSKTVNADTNTFTGVALAEFADPFSTLRIPGVMMLYDNGTNTDVDFRQAFDPDFNGADTIAKLSTGNINGSIDLAFANDRPNAIWGDGQTAGDPNKLVYRRGGTFSGAGFWDPEVHLFDLSQAGTSVAVQSHDNATAISYVNQNDDLYFGRDPNAAPVVYLRSLNSVGPSPLTVDFDATGTFDPEGNLVQLRWQLLDGRGLFTAGPAGFVQQATFTGNPFDTFTCFVQAVDGTGQVSTAVLVVLLT